MSGRHSQTPDSRTCWVDSEAQWDSSGWQIVDGRGEEQHQRLGWGRESWIISNYWGLPGWGDQRGSKVPVRADTGSPVHHHSGLYSIFSGTSSQWSSCSSYKIAFSPRSNFLVSLTTGAEPSKENKEINQHTNMISRLFVFFVFLKLFR